ncbi:MAG: hypothetical protein Kow0098_22700 [Ignavibacteriaceae bacterium]
MNQNSLILKSDLLGILDNANVGALYFLPLPSDNGNVEDFILANWNTTALAQLQAETELSPNEPLSSFKFIRNHQEIKTLLRKGLNSSESITGKIVTDGSSIPLNVTVQPLNEGCLILFSGKTDSGEMEKQIISDEALYRPIIDQASDPIYIFQDDRIVFVNRAWLELFGYKMNEVISDDFDYMSIVAEESKEYIKKRRQDYLGKNNRTAYNNVSYEFKGITKNGKKVDLEVHISPVKWKNQPAGLGIYRDITMRKKVEEEIRQSENRFRAIFEGANIGMIIGDSSGNPRSANESILKLLGYDKEELCGQQVIFDSLLHPDDKEEGKKYFEKLYNYEINDFQFQCRLIRKDGEAVTVNLIVSQFKNQTDDEDFFLALIEDLSEREKAERERLEIQLRYKRLSELTVEGVVIHDKGRMLDANSSFARMFGYSLEELYKVNIIDLLAATEKDREIVFNNVIKGSTHPYEVTGKRKDGTTFPVELEARYVTLEGKEVRVAAVRDITERKKNESIKEALFKISEATNTSRNLDELYSQIHRIVGELLPADNFYIALYDEESDTLSFPFYVDEYDSPPTEPVKLEKGLTEFVLKNEEPLLAPPEVFEMLEKEGKVESIGEPSIDWLGVPLKVNDKTIGVLAIQSYTENVRFGSEELNILQFVSHHIALAIEKKRSEKALKESEEQIRLLLDSTAEAIFAIDNKGKFSLANKACARMLGFNEPQDLIGKEMTEILYSSISSVSGNEIPGDNILRTVSENKGYHSIDEVFRKSDGSHLQVEYWSYPIRKDGEVVGAVVTFLDISERIKNEEKIKRYNKELRILNASKDKLFSIVAHDLKSPFQGLLGLSDILLEEFESLSRDEIRFYISNIHKTTKLVYKLIENLLEWSRLQTGKVNFNATEINLREVVENVESILLGSSSLKGIHIRNEIPSFIYVKADEKMTSSLLQNLISNGIKFTHSGGEIKVTAELNDKFVTVKVSDTGVGISAERVERLFKMDESTSTPGTSDERGTGLGLLLCKEIIQKHGGTISVESSPGAGSTFIFTLPAV